MATRPSTKLGEQVKGAMDYELTPKQFLRLRQRLPPPDADGHIIWTGKLSKSGVPVFGERQFSVRRVLRQMAGLPMKRYVFCNCTQRLCVAPAHSTTTERRYDAPADEHGTYADRNMRIYREVMLGKEADRLAERYSTMAIARRYRMSGKQVMDLFYKVRREVEEKDEGGRTAEGGA